MGRREDEKSEVLCVRRQGWQGTLLKEVFHFSNNNPWRSFALLLCNWPHVINCLFVELIPLLPRWRWLCKQNVLDNPNSSRPGLAATVCWQQVCICFCLGGSWCTTSPSNRDHSTSAPYNSCGTCSSWKYGLLNRGQGAKCTGGSITCLEYLHCLSPRGQKYMNWEKVEVHTSDSIFISSPLLRKGEV